MNRPLSCHLAVFACAALFTLTAHCPAQPPDEAKAPKVQRYDEPPEHVPAWLVFAFNRKGDFPGRSQRVESADPNNPLLAEADEVQDKSRGTFLLSVSDFQSKIDGKNARITFTETLRDNMGNEISHTAFLDLVRKDTVWGTQWNALPGKPQEFLDPAAKNGILRRIATLMAYPREMLTIQYEQASRFNLEQLKGGIFGLTQDFDEVFQIHEATFQEELKYYLPTGQVFYAPADKTGGVSYSFNGELAEVSTEAASKANPVLIYEGVNRQLDFRYNDKALVMFCNGTVKLVTREEAQKLRWTLK